MVTLLISDWVGTGTGTGPGGEEKKTRKRFLQLKDEHEKRKLK